MHFHYQNLNEDKRGKIKGPVLREGRAWLRFDDYTYNKVAFHWQWHFWSNFWGADLRFGAGDNNRSLAFFVGFGLLAFWFTIENIVPKSIIERGRKKALKTKWMGYEYMAWPRNIGIRFFDKGIWFDIWDWDHGW